MEEGCFDLRLTFGHTATENHGLGKRCDEADFRHPSVKGLTTEVRTSEVEEVMKLNSVEVRSHVRQPKVSSAKLQKSIEEFRSSY